MAGRRAGQSWWNWFVTNPKTGQVVTGQFPNVPLWLFIGCTVAARLISADPLHKVLQVGAAIGLLWWAAWELLDGDAPWRRLMGLVATLYALTRLATLLVG